MVGTALEFGAKEALPLRGFPQGNARIRQRNDDFARVFIRPPEGGIREFLVKEEDGFWTPLHEQGSNIVAESHKLNPLDDTGLVMCPYQNALTLNCELDRYHKEVEGGCKEHVFNSRAGDTPRGCSSVACMVRK